MRSVRNITVWTIAAIAGVCLAVGAIGFNTKGAETVTPDRREKSQPHKVVMNYDMFAMWYPAFVVSEDADAETIKRILEEIVDEHGKAQVDRLVQCVWRSFKTWMPNCKSAAGIGTWAKGSIGGRDTLAPRKLNEAGYDMIQVLLDRCGKRKIQFFAGLRMNDRHDVAQKSKFYQEHPEWRLKGYPGGLDYKYEGVRNTILAFIEEVLDRYDVDGIEFDYMRWIDVFRPEEAVKNAPLLTDFTRKARKLLDEAARKRGRGRLLLGVRVPQATKSCTERGFDVAAWVKEGLVDYVCPSDFFYTDFNTRTEDFAKLTEGTDCKVYPSVHAYITAGNHGQILGPANYRAAAKNFYAYGADGVSTYNYCHQWQGMLSPAYVGPPEGWPKALSYLTELRDEEAIAQADRHYVYHLSGVVKIDRIVSDRGGSGPQGTFRFRLAEDLTDAGLSAVLEFKVTGMVQDDELVVGINGKKIRADQIRRSYDADGQSKDEGRPLPAFYFYQMELTSPPARFGDNILGVRLSNSAGTGDIEVQEVEVLVHIKVQD